MTTSRNTGERRTDNRLDTFRERLPAFSRYDLLLAVVPLTLAAVLAVHAILAVPFRLAVVGWATVGLLVLADALYLNPPTSRSGGAA
jgi:hypothetical protein